MNKFFKRVIALWSCTVILTAFSVSVSAQDQKTGYCEKPTSSCTCCPRIFTEEGYISYAEYVEKYGVPPFAEEYTVSNEETIEFRSLDIVRPITKDKDSIKILRSFLKSVNFNF